MHEVEPNVQHGDDGKTAKVGMGNTPTRVSTFADADGGSITLVEWGLAEPFTTDTMDVFTIVHDGAQRHDGV